MSDGITDMNIEIEVKLKNWVKEYYSQGDDYFAYTKKDKWVFGYSNDYPMQHGAGETFSLPTKLIIIIL